MKPHTDIPEYGDYAPDTERIKPRCQEMRTPIAIPVMTKFTQSNNTRNRRCPKCKHEAEKALAALAKQVAEGYGVLPVDEFDALRMKLAEGIDEEKLRTFREDYEFYGAEDGEITASYGGRCDVCKVGLDFKETRGFYTRDPL